MKWFIAAFVVLAIVAVVLRSKSFVSDATWPYFAKKPLTQPEQVLYHRLVATLPEYIVLPQVQLSRVLGVKKGFNFHELNNRINRMSLDFLICLKDSTVVAAIELDDKTHGKESRMKADVKKERALSAAGIALIRWQVSAMPNAATIRQVTLPRFHVHQNVGNFLMNGGRDGKKRGSPESAIHGRVQDRGGQIGGVDW